MEHIGKGHDKASDQDHVKIDAELPGHGIALHFYANGAQAEFAAKTQGLADITQKMIGGEIRKCRPHHDLPENNIEVDRYQDRPDGNGEGRLEKMSSQCV